MELCKCCGNNQADKKNTHYLTDGIIRSCLNEGGTNIRGKGAMYDVSSNKDSIEFKFQQKTSLQAIKEGLGHEPSDDEIDEAMQNEFSVDYIFCTSCENAFTEIETEFIKKILPKLRDEDFTGKTEVTFSENILIRKFFLLQSLRTSLCDPGYSITKPLEEKLKKIILVKAVDPALVISVPLNVTYMNTLGGDFEYTTNTVGIGSENGNHIIMFNDFIIQIFDRQTDVKYVDFFGLNNRETMSYFTNYNEESFRFQVFDNERRKKIMSKFFELKIRRQLSFYLNDLQHEFIIRKGYPPPRFIINFFVNQMIFANSFSDLQRYSMDRYLKIKEALFINLR